MAKSTDKTSEPSVADFPFPYLEMTSFNGNLLSAYTQSGQAIFENAVALNQEMMRFASERLQANVRIFQDLSKCSNWGEAAAVESDFVRSATDAYMAEMPRVTERAAKTCTAMWAPLFEPAQTLPEAVARR